jgi:NADPH:quinone reductase-like Zn-dependent oxidoreductase
MSAALNTVEPPILELVTAKFAEGDKTRAEERLPLLKDRIRDRPVQLSGRLARARHWHHPAARRDGAHVENSSRAAEEAVRGDEAAAARTGCCCIDAVTSTLHAGLIAFGVMSAWLLDWREGRRRELGTGRCGMKAIVVTDEAAGTAGMTLVERPEPLAAINDVIVQIHASGFVPTEMAWPSTWTDRRNRDRTPSIPGHELAGVVSALGYGTTGVSVGQRVLGLADWHRDGSLAEYVAIEARNLAPLPGDVDFAVGASLPISGLTAWQGLFDHGHLRAGQSVLAHGAAGAVGTMVTQLAREAGAYVIGTGRAADRQKALDFGAQEFVDLDDDALEDVGGVDLVFDVIGGDIQKRSASLIRAGGTLVTVVGPPEARPADGLAVDFVVESDRAQLTEIVQRVRDGRLRTNIGNVATLDEAVAALNPTERRTGKTIIRIRP